MVTSEAGRALAAKLRGAARHRPRRRLTSAEETKAGTGLVQLAAERTDLVTRGARPALEHSGNGLGESRHQTAGLLITAGADQDLIPLRRGKSPPSTEYDILAPMESSSPESDVKAEVTAVSREGLSAFIARVLDQLTLSAWLPAALFTAGAAILLQFRRQGSVDVLQAVRVLTADPVRVLVLIIPLLVIATIVTQAFSFEAIRTLEGYWHRRGPAGLARKFMIWRHVRRKENITKRRRKVTKEAFYATRPHIIDASIPIPIVDAFEAQVLGKELPSLTGEECRRLDGMDWENWCDAWRRAQIDHLINDEQAYPIASRVLPTKLGNLMRATEDRLKNAGDDLQGFVLRRYAMAPRRVQMQHDQFRNRLEMYCILVFVSGILLVLTPITLLGRGIDAASIAIISAGFAALGVASYLAALASAGGYLAALKEMDEEPIAEG